MRRRIGDAQQLNIGRHVGTDFGLTNSTTNLTEDQMKVIDEVRNDFINELKKYPADFGYDGTCLIIGYEPDYQFDALCVIVFNFNNIDSCCVKTGTAFGYYGSSIVYEQKYYADYKRKSKYSKFIDKWYFRLKKEFK